MYSILESCLSNMENGLAEKKQNFYSNHDIKIIQSKPLNKSESQPSLYTAYNTPKTNGSPSTIGINKLNNRFEEVYDKMILDDVMTLSDVADRFPDLAIIWKRSMAHIVNASDLKFNNFLVLSNLPVIVSETMALYPGALKLEQEFLVRKVFTYTYVCNIQ